jgi:hypothetical protein
MNTSKCWPLHRIPLLKTSLSIKALFLESMTKTAYIGFNAHTKAKHQNNDQDKS